MFLFKRLRIAKIAGLFLFIPCLILANSFVYEQGFYDQTHEVNKADYQEEFGESAWNGAFNFSLPIEIPPGRNDLQPDLELRYDSQNQDTASFYGYGWNVNIPSISRLNKTGVDNLYTDNYFTSSLTGELVDVNLIDAVHGEYGSKIENGEYLIYEYDANDYWTVTDKKGIVYTFGSALAERQTDPNDDTVISKWMLSEIRDVNDNYISYEYTKDNGQIYPSVVTYTGHDVTDGIFTVEFSTESRTDTSKAYNTGFEVQTNYRINNITASVNGDWVRQYDLAYTTGHNGSRSLLESVTESGKNSDDEIVTLPATEFDYETATESWTEDVNYSIPEYFYENGDNDYQGVDLGDANADGLIDIIGSYSDGGVDVQSTYINNGDGTGWTEDLNYNIPVYFWEGSGNMMKNVRIADVNGDTYPDFIEATSSGNGGAVYDAVYLNNGDGTGWTEDVNYVIPTYFNNGYMEPKGVRVFDVNGDGLPDMVHSEYNHNHGTMKEVYINNGDGTGWTEDVNYTDIPALFYDDGDNEYKGVEIADVNNDGLMDLINSYSDGVSVQSVYINNGDGTGWTEDVNYNIPVYFWEGSGNRMKNVRAADINGDNYPDLVESTSSGNGSMIYNAVYINNGDGTGWTEDIDYEAPAYFNGGYLQDSGTRIVDVDGDAMPDFVQSLYDNGVTQSVYINDSEPIDVLINIEHSKGATSEIDYTPSTELPFIMNTVSEITVNDGLGQESVVAYEYEDGEFYYEDEHEKQFAGFAVVTKTENQERVTKTYYNQGHDDRSLIGKIDKTEIYDNSDNLYEVKFNVWQNYDLGDDNDFVSKYQEIVSEYDGQADHVDRAVSYSYDISTGNIIDIFDWGEVDADEDGNFVFLNLGYFLFTSLEYAEDNNEVIRDLLYNKTFTDHASNVLEEHNYYYDNLPLGEVETGNLTSENMWLDVDNSYLTTSYEYNGYGNIILETNPRNYTTSYDYDQYELYPETITNALNHEQSFVHDYASGQVASETNANSIVTEYSYDGLGRVLAKSIDGTEFLNISYDDNNFPNSATSLILDIEERSYFDGLGRTVQTWQSAEDSNFNLTDYWYNELGNLERQSLPYESNLVDYNDRDLNAEALEYSYDVRDRILNEVSPLGTTTHSYLHGVETITDANSNTKTLSYDVRDSLEQVDDFVYDNDLLGRVTSIVDANGNERNFTYDTLSRKTSQEDIHDPLDVDFGTWEYEYDENGNLTGQTNPTSETVYWQYDELDRVTDENGEYTYTYDTAVNGVGYLANVTNSDYSVDLEYDVYGNINSEQKDILGESFTTEYSHDVLNRLESIVYPSGNQADYTFNTTGRVDSVSYDGADVISDIDYAPNGLEQDIYYANGDQENYIYDPAQNYLLTDKNTTNVANTNLQDLSYTYDAVGNISNINDVSETLTAKIVDYDYDELNRLTVATAVDDLNNTLYDRSYVYDDIGNMTNKSDIGDLLYEENGNANPQAVTSAGSYVYEYDENGNMTSNGAASYDFNYRDQMISSNDGNIIYAYYYDHDGSRVAKADDQDNTVYYANDYYEKEINSDSNVAKDYVIVNGKKVFENEVIEESAFNYQTGNRFFRQTNPNAWRTIVFPEAFDAGTNVVVFAQIQSERNGQDVRIDIKNVNEDRFRIRLEEDRGADLSWHDGVHPKELVSWVAFDMDNLPEGVYGGITGLNQNLNNNISQTISYDQAFDPGTEPIVYAQTQTNKAQTVEVDITDANETDFTVELQEDTGNGTPGDYDGAHGYEAVAWIAFDPANNPFGTVAGSVDINQNWEFVSFGQTLDSVPKLFALDVSENETDNCIVDVKGVNPNGFRVRMEELDLANWDILHADEDVRYFTVEENNQVTEQTNQYYFHNDHLGGPSIITDESGDIVQTLDYYPYGSQYINDQVGDYDSRYDFTGKELDESNLHYFEARHYDSEIGRFISQDPWQGDLTNPQSLNKYSYVENNPIRYNDPTGNFRQDTFDQGTETVQEGLKDVAIGACKLNIDMKGGFVDVATGSYDVGIGFYDQSAAFFDKDPISDTYSSSVIQEGIVDGGKEQVSDIYGYVSEKVNDAAQWTAEQVSNTNAVQDVQHKAAETASGGNSWFTELIFDSWRD